MTDQTAYLLQTDAPLFEDLLWSRPEHKSKAGKMLVIGGHAYHFQAPVRAHQEALAAGAGSITVIMPEHLKKTLGTDFEDVQFAPSNQSGSFSKDALANIRELVQANDGFLLAGDLSRSSETILMLDDLLNNSSKTCVITGDVMDTFSHKPPDAMLKNKDLYTAVITFAQLQKLAKNQELTKAFTSDMSLANFADNLNILAKQTFSIITFFGGKIWVAADGILTATPVESGEDTFWRLPVAAAACVLAIQFPSNKIEALTSGAYLAFNS